MVWLSMIAALVLGYVIHWVLDEFGFFDK